MVSSHSVGCSFSLSDAFRCTRVINLNTDFSFYGQCYLCLKKLLLTPSLWRYFPLKCFTFHSWTFWVWYEFQITFFPLDIKLILTRSFKKTTLSPLHVHGTFVMNQVTEQYCFFLVLYCLPLVRLLICLNYYRVIVHLDIW